MLGRFLRDIWLFHEGRRNIETSGGKPPRRPVLQALDFEAARSEQSDDVGADIVEHDPCCDLAKMTATVAAKLAKEIAGMMIQTAR
jgi:hypothetical protein